LSGQFSATNLQHFAIIIDSILAISNSVTTLSVARLSSLSYLTIQRFYALKDVNWLLVNLLLFKHFIYQKGKSYLLGQMKPSKVKRANKMMVLDGSIRGRQVFHGKTGYSFC